MMVKTYSDKYSNINIARKARKLPMTRLLTDPRELVRPRAPANRLTVNHH